MRPVKFLSLAVAISLLASSCTPVPVPQGPEGGPEMPENDDTTGTTQSEETMTITITVGSQVFKADIEDTETGKAFLAKLPLTLDMSELNGNEKYSYGVSLPKADKYCSSVAAGDLMLFGGSCLVLFYGPAGGYSYTRIGRLQSTDGLAAALGKGSVRVRFGKE